MTDQRCFIRRQPVRFDEACIGGDDVATLEHEDVTGNDRRGRYNNGASVAEDTRLRRRHRT